MSVSAEFLERAAAETGYRPIALEKVIRLGELARDIAAHPYLGKVLALKGGTALNLCYGAGPTRLSVDLDFNYVGHLERALMLEDRPRVEQAVEELGRRRGYRVQRSADACKRALGTHARDRCGRCGCETGISRRRDR